MLKNFVIIGLLIGSGYLLYYNCKFIKTNKELIEVNENLRNHLKSVDEANKDIWQTLKEKIKELKN